MAIRVLVADDHELVREGIRRILEGSDIQVSCEAKGGEEAVRLSARPDVDVVLLDVRMNDGDGLYALGRIKLERPDLPVLIFSAYDNPTYIAKAWAHEAAGYVLKGESAERLVEAIRTAAAGETIWTRDIQRRLTGAMATERLSGDVEVPLTKRESEVLNQLALGLTNKEIAQTLKISYETVKEHVQHILRKIGVSDRTQAAIWAVRRGLID